MTGVIINPIKNLFLDIFLPNGMRYDNIANPTLSRTCNGVTFLSTFSWNVNANIISSKNLFLDITSLIGSDISVNCDQLSVKFSVINNDKYDDNTNVFQKESMKINAEMKVKGSQINSLNVVLPASLDILSNNKLNFYFFLSMLSLLKICHHFFLHLISLSLSLPLYVVALVIVISFILISIYSSL
jgi:hypothetical protein